MSDREFPKLPMRCVCGHTIADHEPVTDEWLIGARTVTETREQCERCDCDDFEEGSWDRREETLTGLLASIEEA